jgi:hypothetical protein
MKLIGLPDGSEAEFPDTMDDAAIGAVLRKQFPPKPQGLTPQAQAFRPADALTAAPSGMEEFLGGAKHAWNKGAQGLKELLPAPVQEAGDWLEQKLTGKATNLPELNRQGEAFVRETGPASTAGEIGGQIALTAAPAARVFKAVAGANPALWRGLAAGASAGAAPAAVLTPGGLAERGEAAAYDAAGGMAGEAGGRVLKRAMTGLVTPSQSARELMAQGIQPTVGQGAASSAIHAAEDLTAGLPLGIGQMVRSGQKRAIGEFQGNVFADALGGDDALKQFAKLSPRTQVEWIDNVLKPRYDQLLDGMPPVHVSPELRAGLSRSMDRMPVDVRTEYNRIMTDYLANPEPLTGRRLKDLTTELGELTGDLLDSGSAMEKRAARVIGEQRGKLKELMPPEMQGVDDLYSKFLRMKEASYRTLKPEEGITPAAYQQAVKQTSLGDSFARGEATGQALSDPAQILKTSPNSGMSMLASGGAAGLAHLTGLNIPAIVAAAMSALGSTRTGAQVAFGNTNVQKTMAELLRNSPAPAVVGAAIAEKNRRKPLNQY